MKVFEILSENKPNSPFADIGLVEYIRRNCQPWLKATENGKYQLFRGFRRIDDEVAFVRKVRNDRQPLDSSIDDHNAFNEMIKVCGKVANRSNSVFTTSDPNWARMYGVVYNIMAVGNFHYTWHTDFDDWTTHSERIISIGRADPDYGELSMGPHRIDIEWVKDAFCPHLRGDDGSLIEGIQSKNEIMLACEQVLAIRPHVYEDVLRSVLGGY